MVGVVAPPEEEIGESARSLWETALEAMPRVGVAVAIVVGGWAVARVLRWGLSRVLERRRSPSFARVMSSVLSWVFLGIVVLLAVAVTFPSVRPVDVLAGLGVFSLAVGFAFQDILENTLAGILLLFRQPFRSGDQIEVVGQIGTVREINIRETQLVTFDGELVIIPNRDVYKNVIVVRTYNEHRRLHFVVGIAYDSDAGRATRVIGEALRTVRGVERSPEPIAVVDELGVSTVDVRALFWTRSCQRDAIRVRDEAIRAVKLALEEAAIEMPASIVAVQAAPSFRAALLDAAKASEEL